MLSNTKTKYIHESVLITQFGARHHFYNLWKKLLKSSILMKIEQIQVSTIFFFGFLFNGINQTNYIEEKREKKYSKTEKKNSWSAIDAIKSHYLP